MEHAIVSQGSGALLQVSLDKGESVKAESNAMVMMSGNIKVEGKMDGGLGSSLKRVLLGGDSFFLQQLTAERTDGVVFLAPSLPGDIAVLDVGPSKQFCLQKGAFLAGMGGAGVDTKMQNLAKGLFSGAGLFIQKTTGTGKVAVSAFGAIQDAEVPDGEEFVVDTGHLVAWSEGMSYSIEKASKSWLSSATSGEWLVCRFKGPGKLWIQTRNAGAFGDWVRSMVPTK